MNKIRLILLTVFLNTNYWEAKAHIFNDILINYPLRIIIECPKIHNLSRNNEERKYKFQKNKCWLEFNKNSINVMGKIIIKHDEVQKAWSLYTKHNKNPNGSRPQTWYIKYVKEKSTNILKLHSNIDSLNLNSSEIQSSKLGKIIKYWLLREN